MKDMNKFATEMDKMDMATETWDDMVDIFDGDGVEEESDAIVDGVMTELGISLGAQMQDAPTSVFQLPGNNVASRQGQNQVSEAASASSSSSSSSSHTVANQSVSH